MLYYETEIHEYLQKHIEKKQQLEIQLLTFLNACNAFRSPIRPRNHMISPWNETFSKLFLYIVQMKTGNHLYQ